MYVSCDDFVKGESVTCNIYLCCNLQVSDVFNEQEHTSVDGIDMGLQLRSRKRTR